MAHVESPMAKLSGGEQLSKVEMCSPVCKEEENENRRSESSGYIIDNDKIIFDNEEDNIFFDTIGVQFHFGQFMWQLIAHLVLPLFPFMINRTGQLQNDVYTRFSSWVTPVIFYIMFLSYALSTDHLQLGMHGTFLIPAIYIFQHRLVIAIKYGSLSRTEYKKFMECKDPALSRIYLDQMQLFQGWYYCNPRVLHFELAAASARIGARINDIDLHIANPHSSPSALNQCRAWNALLRGHDVIDFNSGPCNQMRLMPDGSYSLSVYDFCEALAMKSIRNKPESDLWSGRVTDFFNLVNLFIPFALLLGFYDGAPLSATNSFWVSVFFITSTLLNFFYAKIFYILLNIAVVDVFRELTTMQDLNCMIRMTDLMLSSELSGVQREVTREQQKTTELRITEILSIKSSRRHKQPPHTECLKDETQRHHIHTNPKRGSVLGERIYKDNETHLLPRISFDESDNIVAWTHARLVMQNFGERFHFRLSLYVIAAITMLLLMMVLGLLKMGMSPQRTRLFLTPWFLQVLLSVVMCIGFVVLILQTGTCVNETLDIHAQTMSSHALRLHRKIQMLQAELRQETSDDEKEHLNTEIAELLEVKETLSDMKEVIETNTAIKPFKIFGFTAQSSLTMSVLTTALSFFAILTSLLFKAEGRVLQQMG